MGFRWSYHSLPELSRFSRGRRQRIWHRCCLRAALTWRLWVGLAILMLATLLLILPLVMMLTASYVVGGEIRLILGLAALMCLYAFGMSQVLMWVARPFLHYELPGFCRRCGYDLTGNVSGVCPECGQPAGPAADFGDNPMR